MVELLEVMVGFKFELIVTFRDTVFEQPVDRFVSVMVAIPVPALAQFTEIEFVFCPDAIVPPVTDQEKVFPEFITE